MIGLTDSGLGWLLANTLSIAAALFGLRVCAWLLDSQARQSQISALATV